MQGGKEKVPSRSFNKTQPGARCNISLAEEFSFFTLVLFLQILFYGLI